MSPSAPCGRAPSPEDIAQDLHGQGHAREARAPELVLDRCEDLDRGIVDAKVAADVVLGVARLARAVAAVQAHEDARHDGHVHQAVAATILPHFGEHVLIVDTQGVVGLWEGDGEPSPPPERSDVAVDHRIQLLEVEVHLLRHLEALEQVFVVHELLAELRHGELVRRYTRMGTQRTSDRSCT